MKSFHYDSNQHSHRSNPQAGKCQSCVRNQKMHNASAYKSDVNFGTMTGTKTFLLLWILVVRVNIHDKMGLISDPLQWNSHGFFLSCTSSIPNNSKGRSLCRSGNQRKSLVGWGPPLFSTETVELLSPVKSGPSKYLKYTYSDIQWPQKLNA